MGLINIFSKNISKNISKNFYVFLRIDKNFRGKNPANDDRPFTILYFALSHEAVHISLPCAGAYSFTRAQFNLHFAPALLLLRENKEGVSKEFAL